MWFCENISIISRPLFSISRSNAMGSIEDASVEAKNSTNDADSASFQLFLGIKGSAWVPEKRTTVSDPRIKCSLEIEKFADSY
jgi:hypothetical protein